MALIQSFEVAISYLNDALLKVEEARTEIRKWRHPAEAEIAGISWNITKKINRLEELRKWTQSESQLINNLK